MKLWTFALIAWLLFPVTASAASTCREAPDAPAMQHCADAIFDLQPDAYDEDCYTLGEVVRRLASLHQYGGDMSEYIDGLVKNGVDPDKIASYRHIASDIAASPRLLTEDDREFAIEYHVEHYLALCS